MTASSMILIGYLLILGLAGYWMRRAAKAEERIFELEDGKEDAMASAWEMFVELIAAQSRLERIIALETKSMAHVGKKAVAIARGDI